MEIETDRGEVNFTYDELKRKMAGSLVSLQNQESGGRIE